MGLRFRKSINLGFGFRVNISKSGIGYSWGVPGYRVTKKVNGDIRTTYSLPGTGISYVEDESSSDDKQVDTYENFYKIENGNIDVISSPENKIFVKTIKSILIKRIITWSISLAITLLSLLLLLIINKLIAGLIILFVFVTSISTCIIINTKCVINLEYLLDDETEKDFMNINNALSAIAKCHYIWNITDYSINNNIKYHAGAYKSLGRILSFLEFVKLPTYLKEKNNSKFYRLKLGNIKYYFLPDKILMIDNLNVGALKYSDIKIYVEDSYFREDDITPKDSKFMYYTWKYVNKDGSRDKRFSSNYQIPVYLYGTIYIKSKSGLNIELLVTNKENAVNFKDLFNKVNRVF